MYEKYASIKRNAFVMKLLTNIMFTYCLTETWLDNSIDANSIRLIGCIQKNAKALTICPIES